MAKGKENVFEKLIDEKIKQSLEIIVDMEMKKLYQDYKIALKNILDDILESYSAEYFEEKLGELVNHKVEQRIFMIEDAVERFESITKQLIESNSALAIVIQHYISPRIMEIENILKREGILKKEDKK